MQARRRHTGLRSQPESYENNTAANTSTIHIIKAQENELTTNEHLSDMSCRDRTQEFMSTVKSMQSRQVSMLAHCQILYGVMLQLQLKKTN